MNLKKPDMTYYDQSPIFTQNENKILFQIRNVA